MKRDIYFAIFAASMVFLAYCMAQTDDIKTREATREYEAKVIKQARDRHERERRDDEVYRELFGRNVK